MHIQYFQGKSDVSLNSCINLFMREEQLDHDERPVCISSYNYDWLFGNKILNMIVNY